MFARKLLVDRLTRWSKLVEDPSGFPEHPDPNHCWIWTGAYIQARNYNTMVARTPDKPLVLEQRYAEREARASFLGQPVAPHRVLIAFHLGKDLHEIGRVSSTCCGGRSCINPLHWDKIGEQPTPRMTYSAPLPEPEPEYEPEPEPSERDRAFKLFYNHSVLVGDTPKDVRQRGIYNQDFIDSYLNDYQQWIFGKTKAEIDEMIHASSQ